MKIDRRTLVQILAAATASPASGQVHSHGDAPAAAAAGSAKAPLYFSKDQYALLRTLCQHIIPADAESGGAIEAGAPEFIDLLTSENTDYQHRLSGGLMWLDAQCMVRYEKPFLTSTADQQKKLLDLISHHSNMEHDPSLRPGVQFFATLRDLTLDGFFTSRIGIEYLGFRGNGALAKFDGCPPVKS